MYKHIAGKIYGWAPVFEVEIHLSSGTVIRHPFYKFRKREGGLQWASPTTIAFRSVDDIVGWRVVKISRKFQWAEPNTYWTFKD